MAESSDGCLQRPRQKTAGATLYLMEELGDARLRCDQLMRGIAEAVTLIEKSSHKDHFFEVAGHLIQSIPDVAFRLQKALQAVALAADRIDYEELKQELRPEKVEELERVLKEVRIRHVHHRSENPMTPKQAAERLRQFAMIAREEGALPLHELAGFIHDLDPGRTASTAQPAADSLDKLAQLLDDPATQGVSRAQLATLLSRIAMEAEFNTVLRLASKPKLTQEFMQLADVSEVKKKFKEQNPDISDADLNEIAKQWESNKDVVKDKSAADAGLPGNFENIKVLAVAAARAASVSRWRPALLNMLYIVDEIGTILVQLGSMDTNTSEKLKREIRQLLPQAAHNIEERSELSVQAAWKAADASEDAKRSRFEEGVSADPTENMTPEDAKKWKEEHDNNKDNFKAAKSETAEGHTFKVDPYKRNLDNGTMYQITVTDPDKKTKAYRKLFKTEQQAEDVVKDLVKGLKNEEGLNPSSWEKVATDPDTHMSRFEEGKPADPTENMSPEDAKKWKTEHENNKDNFKAAAEAWKA